MKTMRLSHRGRVREIRLDAASAEIDGRRVDVERLSGGGPIRRLLVDGRAFRVASVRAGERTFVWCEGSAFEFEAATRAARTSPAAEHGGGLVAPMPGRVRRLFVEAGAAVERGQTLLVLEAMKMEHAIRAPEGGVVRRLVVGEGDLVEAGAELVELLPAKAGG